MHPSKDKKENRASANSKRITNSAGKTFHRLGAGLAGIWLTSMIIYWTWPKTDQFDTYNSEARQQIGYIPKINEELNVFLIGTEKTYINRNKDSSKKLVSFTIIRLIPKDKIKIIHIPTKTYIRIPDETSIKSLPETYQIGDVALTTSAVSEGIGIQLNTNQRFIVFSNLSLEKLIQEIGGIDLKKEIVASLIEKANHPNDSAIT